ncbi:MAG: hypothetical protein AAGN66_08650 [Acidobacteriota bacterium]
MPEPEEGLLLLLDDRDGVEARRIALPQSFPSAKECGFWLMRTLPSFGGERAGALFFRGQRPIALLAVRTGQLGFLLAEMVDVVYREVKADCRVSFMQRLEGNRVIRALQVFGIALDQMVAKADGQRVGDHLLLGGSGGVAAAGDGGLWDRPWTWG